jgi:hypothetical protein
MDLLLRHTQMSFCSCEPTEREREREREDEGGGGNLLCCRLASMGNTLTNNKEGTVFVLMTDLGLRPML